MPHYFSGFRNMISFPSPGSFSPGAVFTRLQVWSSNLDICSYVRTWLYRTCLLSVISQAASTSAKLSYSLFYGHKHACVSPFLTLALSFLPTWNGLSSSPFSHSFFHTSRKCFLVTHSAPGPVLVSVGSSEWDRACHSENSFSQRKQKLIMNG